jgi:hypothetical protein
MIIYELASIKLPCTLKGCQSREMSLPWDQTADAPCQAGYFPVCALDTKRRSIILDSLPGGSLLSGDHGSGKTRLVLGNMVHHVEDGMGLTQIDKKQEHHAPSS